MARWSRRPRTIKSVVRRRAKKVRDDGAIELVDRVIDGTPVRDGWARGSIFVGDGTSPKRRSPTGRESFNDAVSAIRSTPLDAQIRIRSTLSYILRLEHGWSPQGRAFFQGSFESGRGVYAEVVNMNARL